MDPQTVSDHVASWVADLPIIALVLSPAILAHPQAPRSLLEVNVVLTLGALLVASGVGVRLFALNPDRPTLHHFGANTLMTGGILVILGFASLDSVQPYQFGFAFPLLLIATAWGMTVTDPHHD